MQVVDFHWKVGTASMEGKGGEGRGELGEEGSISRSALLSENYLFRMVRRSIGQLKSSVSCTAPRQGGKKK